MTSFKVNAYLFCRLTVDTIPAEFTTCPKSLTVMAADAISDAKVGWPGPHGDTINARLPVGDHHYSYSLLNGKNCEFTISVKGMRSPLDL